MNKLLLLTLFLFFNVAGFAQPSVSSRFVEKDIDSKILGENVSTWILLPEDHDPNAMYSVMYVLDADGHFSYMGNYADYLAKSFANIAPQMYVVGIRSKSPQFRYKYFTPYVQGGKEGYGSAGDFLKFMKEEMMQYMNSSYKTGGRNVLAGHSLAGLFALYAIAESPGTFTHVIAASPSVTYENEAIFSYIDKLKNTEQEKLYFSVAGNDVNGYHTSIEKLKDQLSSGDWKNWKYELIEGTNHYSTAPLSFYKGLLYLFAD